MPSLHPLLSGFAPIWALTGIGYLVGRTRLLGPHAETVLNRFVFHVAMPAGLFLLISRTPLGRFANPSMLAFMAGTAVATGLGLLAGHLFFRREPGELAIGAMASGYVNSANLGIPVTMQVLGDASFVGPVMLFQILLVTPAVLAVLDGGAAGRRALLTLPLRNPILLAAALGAVVSATGLHLPAELTRSGDLLGGAGVPTALIALGMSLHNRPSADGRSPGDRPLGERPFGDHSSEGRSRRAEVGLTVAVKTLVQPLVALAVAGPLLHLPPHQLLTVVLFSALPTAQNVYTYAREYGQGAVLARDTVLWSTLVSMATLSVISWALGPA
ncbi:AEC family transporter [Streptomyces sp. FH025]|uniref:AEC family transporter n=1 Tax=Streptomyces sp. FH025 TaxID=2815937 RepID=UPI001A9CF3ED|nr:AEC family transporter [Streptomyces sp. FH025]MBO1419850.1 AEC family transporter [Streptomyces sp. FH025]